MSWLKRNVVMLSTDEEAKVGMINFAPYNREGHKLELIHYVSNGDGLNLQHLYILSDDKIEEGEYCYDEIENRVIFNQYKTQVSKKRKKIIATTDTSLKIIKKTNNPALTEHINNGYVSSTYEDILPQPSQGFIKVLIEEYNKGNAITDVMVEYESIGRMKSGGIETNIIEMLKINPKDNTITIKKLKDSWSREELQKLFDSYGGNLTAKIIWEDIKNL